jgi:hypothetical protein
MALGQYPQVVQILVAVFHLNPAQNAPDFRLWGDGFEFPDLAKYVIGQVLKH